MADRLIQLLKFLDEDPEDAFNLYSVAYEYLNRDDLAQAMKHFLKLKNLHPDYVGLYYHLGKTYERQEKYESAQQAYDEGLLVARKLKDRHAESELQRAQTQLRDEREDW
ncbi:MAG: tetratricopeptide repeat protein [Bacteroidota bacterium]